MTVVRVVIALLLLGVAAWRLYLEGVEGRVAELTTLRLAYTAMVLGGVLLLVLPTEKFTAAIAAVGRLMGRDPK